jgi:polyferredoxin
VAGFVRKPFYGDGFRKIEYWIEGDRNKQMKLDRQEWDAEKIRKRLTKWSVFILISHYFDFHVHVYCRL